MKILYIHDKEISSGKANVIQVLHMCSAFSDLGLDVTLMVPHEPDNSPNTKQAIEGIMAKKTTFSIVHYPKFTLHKRLSMLGGYLGVRKRIKHLQCDFAFVRNPVYVNATLRKGFHTIFESHNALLHEEYKILDLFWRKNLLMNTTSEQLVKFITISYALARKWKSRGVPEAKVIALHDGVDPDDFSPFIDQTEARKEFSLPMNSKIVLYAGSLYPNRGIEDILKLARSFPFATFLVLGAPAERKNHYTRLCNSQKIENICFTGYLPHYRVKKYLMAADVLLMIWSKEVKTINYCSPLKMFEYMAAGRIIVGHAFPTIKEVLTDGETAYLANPDSFGDLQKKLALSLKQSYPNPIAQAARRLAFEKYSWKSRAQAILQALNRTT